MWYFTWILGLGAALAFGIINVMWLEASFGDMDDKRVADGLLASGQDGGPARQDARAGG
jgi:cyd operon protein YbgT